MRKVRSNTPEESVGSALTGDDLVAAFCDEDRPIKPYRFKAASGRVLEFGIKPISFVEQEKYLQDLMIPV